MPERVVVGVDAGGSRTVAIAACGDEVFAAYTAGAANAATAGAQRAAETIAEAIAGALAGRAADAAYVGAAGAWNAQIASALRDALAARIAPARVWVTNDVEIALRAAVPEGDALLLLAGTGSIAYAEIGAQRLRCGGLGHAIGDEGSGYAIGAAALRLLGRALDGRAARDGLLDALASTLGVADAAALVAASASPERIASVAQLVVERAGDGDRAANKIVQAAALDLFELLRSLVRRAECAQRDLPLVFAGGLLARNTILSYLLETRIANEFPHLRVLKDVPPPHLGALAAARRFAEQA
jgi:N-acetylglucosamine kinase-like BadF-type ATPase